jgi:WD40 repeat protein
LVIEYDAPGDVPPQERVHFEGERKDKAYRRWDKTTSLDPSEVLRVVPFRYLYRKLEVGERVARGQMLGLIRSDLARDDLSIKIAKYRAAETERQAAAKTRDEAENRYKDMLAANRITSHAVSQEDVRAGRLTWERYILEAKAKAEAVVQAERELLGAYTVLQMHEIKASIDGVVRAIYKQRSEAVKNLEPLLRLENLDRLRVEGVVEVQDARRFGLKRDSEVQIDATRPESPRLILRGHTQKVTCVAVARPLEARGRPLLVSGSDDRSLRIWDSSTGKELWAVTYPAPVRAVACTSRLAPRNLILVGNSDGSVHLLDLQRLTTSEPQELAAGHHSAVNSVAFSSDGTYCLTGGDDRRVTVWKLEDSTNGLRARLLHTLSNVHRAPVTAVQFVQTDRPGRVQFITVSQDKSLVLWTMTQDGAPARTTEFDQRQGDVATLSASGGRVLFDQGRELLLRSLEDPTRILGRLSVPQDSSNFSTMALFSPDGATILTNCASDNRVQLWRTPSNDNCRGTELRQYVWNTGAVTCGAFDPDNAFVVCGTDDQGVLVWNMPTQKEIAARLKGRIALLEKALDSSSRQVRVWANLESRPAWLLPGLPATILVPPKTIDP